MKKLVLMFVAVAAMSFASCGGNKAEAPAAPIEEEVEAVEDSIATDSVEVEAEEAPAAEEVAE